MASIATTAAHEVRNAPTVVAYGTPRKDTEEMHGGTKRNEKVVCMYVRSCERGGESIDRGGRGGDSSLRSMKCDTIRPNRACCIRGGHNLG